jgi:hypothetical protein
MSTDGELPHGGTVRDLQVQLAASGTWAQTRFATMRGRRLDDPDNLAAMLAMSNSWALASVIGFLADEHPDLARRAACIVQMSQVDGEVNHCDHITPDEIAAQIGRLPADPEARPR